MTSIQLVALCRERHATSNYAHDYLCHATVLKFTMWRSLLVLSSGSKGYPT